MPEGRNDPERMATIAKLLRDALDLAEGGTNKPLERENMASLLAGALLKLIQHPTKAPGGGPQEDMSIEFLLGILQKETDRLEAAKAETKRKDTELALKLQFAKDKEKELQEREAALARLEAQLRVRENLLQKREAARPH